MLSLLLFLTMNVVSGRRLLQQDYIQFYLQQHDPNVVTFEVVPCNGVERRDIALTLEDGAFFQGEVLTSKTLSDNILAVVADSDPVIAPLDTLASRLQDQLSQRLGCSLRVVNLDHVFEEIMPEKNIFAANERSVESALEALAGRRALSSPPSSMDLRNQIPGGVRKQEFGDCAAFSGATMKAYQEHVDYGLDEMFSPRFIYAFRDQSEDSEGMTFSEVFSVLSTKGALEEAKMPYSGMNNGHTGADISQEHLDDALNHRTSSSSSVTLKTQDYSSVDSFKTDFKNAMHNFGVGLVQTPVYHYGCEMWKGDGERLSAHAMTTVGYDENGILIQNSWGTTWCNSGYTTVSWSDAVDYVRKFAFASDLPSPFTLELPSNNWSRRYNKRKSHGWYCTGGWQANWEGRPDEEVVNFDSVQLEVLSAADKTYRVVSEADSAGLMFGTGKDCFAWDHCGASQYRGGFSIDFRGTGYELVSSQVVRNGWGASMYVSQDGAAYSASSSTVTIADGTQRVEASCGGWCGGCQAELVVRPVQ